MLQFAQSQGVPASALFAEGESRNTIQNAYYSYKIMQAHDWTSALVVTSPTHVRRASLIFQPLSSCLANGCGALATRFPSLEDGSGSGAAKLATPATDVSSAFPTHGNICPILISRCPGSKENRPSSNANSCPRSQASSSIARNNSQPCCCCCCWRSACGYFTAKRSPRETTTSPAAAVRCGKSQTRWRDTSPPAAIYPMARSGYRVAGLPLTLQRVLAGQNADTSTWEMRHELGYVLLLLHSGFLLTGIFLGGALWWVTRRLYGNPGGFIALALYCFSPRGDSRLYLSQQRNSHRIWTVRLALHRHGRSPRHAGAPT